MGLYLVDMCSIWVINIQFYFMNVKQIDFSKFIEGSPHLEYELPVSKLKVKVTLMSDTIQKEINEFMESLMKIHPEMNTEVTSRLKHLILSVFQYKRIVLLKLLLPIDLQRGHLDQYRIELY